MIVFAQEKQPAASGWMSRSEADRAKQLHAGPGLSGPLKKPHPLRLTSLCMCLTKSVGGSSLPHLRGSGSKTIDGRLPISLRRRVFDLYGMRAGEPTSYNVDHLIPVSLGGANSVKNLWPQPLAREWSYPNKNRIFLRQAQPQNPVGQNWGRKLTENRPATLS